MGAAGPPLAEQAFRRLRHDLLCGRLAPDSKLKVEQLRSAYGVSSSPLREALNRLSQEGLVRTDQRRGFRVAPLSREDLADITRLRLSLEVQALVSSIRDGDDVWEGLVVAAFHRLEKVESRLTDGPVALSDEWAALHRAFHLALLAACGSPRLLGWTSSLFDQAERYRRAAARDRTVPRRKSSEHRRLMDATLARDGASACSLLEQHVTETLRHFDAVRAAASR